MSRFLLLLYSNVIFTENKRPVLFHSVQINTDNCMQNLNIKTTARFELKPCLLSNGIRNGNVICYNVALDTYDSITDHYFSITFFWCAHKLNKFLCECKTVSVFRTLWKFRAVSTFKRQEFYSHKNTWTTQQKRNVKGNLLVIFGVSPHTWTPILIKLQITFATSTQRTFLSPFSIL